jgi:hypothetical protein
MFLMQLALLLLNGYTDHCHQPSVVLEEIFLYYRASRLALGLTQPPKQSSSSSSSSSIIIIYLHVKNPLQVPRTG